ncbi:hypothetical protein [Streptobacillus canis]|uniref:hypothetical protein n=1 Tax=Streptobacillus canis TaxID=2678686 RepID=UPI0012E1F7D3|nr:hypothetical protein [Streptobacillus canis]
MDKIIFTYDGVDFHLPFSTALEINREYDDYEFTNILGETYAIPGNARLREFEITGIISEKDYVFYSRRANKNLSSYINFFDRPRKEKKPLLITIGNDNTTIVQMECLASFSYSNLDRVGDISFNIKVKEYKEVEI